MTTAARTNIKDGPEANLINLNKKNQIVLPLTDPYTYMSVKS